MLYEHSFLGPYIAPNSGVQAEATRMADQLQLYSQCDAISDCPKLKILITRLQTKLRVKVNENIKRYERHEIIKRLKNDLPLAHEIEKFLQGLVQKNALCRPIVEKTNKAALHKALNKEFYPFLTMLIGALIGACIGLLISIYALDLLGWGSLNMPLAEIVGLVVGLIVIMALFGLIGGFVGNEYGTARKQAPTVRAIMAEITHVAQRAQKSLSYSSTANPRVVTAEPSSKSGHSNTHTAASRGYSDPITSSTPQDTLAKKPDGDDTQALHRVDLRIEPLP